jgi:hypothetical protein
MRGLCGRRAAILGENNRVVLGHTYDDVEVAIQVRVAATGTFINRCFAWCFFSTIELAIFLVEIHLFSNLARHDIGRGILRSSSSSTHSMYLI